MSPVNIETSFFFYYLYSDVTRIKAMILLLKLYDLHDSCEFCDLYTVRRRRPTHDKYYKIYKTLCISTNTSYLIIKFLLLIFINFYYQNVCTITDCRSNINYILYGRMCIYVNESQICETNCPHVQSCSYARGIYSRAKNNNM